MAKDTISYEDAFGLTSPPAAPSNGGISYEDAFGLPQTPPKRRTLASVANDTVIEVANAAAGGVSAAANFVRPERKPLRRTISTDRVFPALVGI